MPRRRGDEGDDRHIPVDFKRIARTQWSLGLFAAACLVAAFLIPALQGPLLLVGIFSGLAIGWVE